MNTRLIIGLLALATAVPVVVLQPAWWGNAVAAQEETAEPVVSDSGTPQTREDTKEMDLQMLVDRDTDQTLYFNGLNDAVEVFVTAETLQHARLWFKRFQPDGSLSNEAGGRKFLAAHLVLNAQERLVIHTSEGENPTTVNVHLEIRK